jgi:hypothetical protein
MHKDKPLGGKSYGSIGHLPGSGIGKGDHFINEGETAIALGRHHRSCDYHVIVTEKLDGTNVGVAKINGQIVPLTRSGYRAESSPFRQHHLFAEWVYYHQARFDELLNDGERVCGEWLLQTHSIRYDLPHEPFVVFDMFSAANNRYLWEDIVYYTRNKFVTVAVKKYNPNEVYNPLVSLDYSAHGAIDKPEGAVWRVEGKKKGKVAFLCKYVRPDFEPGKYFDTERWNTFPTDEWLKRRLF